MLKLRGGFQLPEVDCAHWLRSLGGRVRTASLKFTPHSLSKKSISRCIDRSKVSARLLTALTARFHLLCSFTRVIQYDRYWGFFAHGARHPHTLGLRLRQKHCRNDPPHCTFLGKGRYAPYYTSTIPLIRWMYPFVAELRLFRLRLEITSRMSDVRWPFLSGPLRVLGC